MCTGMAEIQSVLCEKWGANGCNTGCRHVGSNPDYSNSNVFFLFYFGRHEDYTDYTN
jgi:hypothetical protein